MKNVISNQPCVSLNFCTEFSKAQVNQRLYFCSKNCIDSLTLKRHTKVYFQSSDFKLQNLMIYMLVGGAPQNLSWRQIFFELRK